MEQCFFEVTPKFVTAMATVSHLSQFQPPLGLQLRGAIVAWALRLMLIGSPGHISPQREAVQKQAEKGLQRMLQELLRENPSAGQLVGLLEQMAYWMHCRWADVRARTFSLISSLLQFDGHLPSFKIINEAAPGHLLVQLAVSLADPVVSIRAQAREIVGQLHSMLLCQRGLHSKRKEPLWRADPGQLRKEGYQHLVHVGEVFWKHLTPEQRETYLEGAWEATVCLGQEWVREGGLLLLYSLLGWAHEVFLEEEEEDDIKRSLSAHLYKLWRGRGVPQEIGALLQKTDD